MGQGVFFGGEVSCGVCGEHSAMLAPRAVEGKRTWRRVGNVSALLMNASHDPRETSAPLWPTIATMLLAAMVVYLPAAVGADLLQFDDNFFFGPDTPLVITSHFAEPFSDGMCLFARFFAGTFLSRR